MQERVFLLMLKIKLRKETKWQVYFRILPDVGKQDSCFTKFDIWLLIRRSRFSSNFDFNFNFESRNGNFFFWKIYNKERKNCLNILICFYISFYCDQKNQMQIRKRTRIGNFSKRRYFSFLPFLHYSKHILYK